MAVHFTEAEKRVIKLVLEGKTREKIADILSISIHTVKAHLESIYRKCGIHNKMQLALYIMQNDI